MKYASSKKLGHASGLSRLTPKYRTLEDTVIATLKNKRELKEVLVNTVCELPVIAEEIKIKSYSKKIEQICLDVIFTQFTTMYTEHLLNVRRTFTSCTQNTWLSPIYRKKEF